MNFDWLGFQNVTVVYLWKHIKIQSHLNCLWLYGNLVFLIIGLWSLLLIQSPFICVIYQVTNVASNPAVTHAAIEHQGHLFWITCKPLKLLRKASHLQVIQNSAPSVVRRCQCDIRICYYLEFEVCLGTFCTTIKSICVHSF